MLKQSDFIKKRDEFKEHYKSQHTEFAESDFKLGNWERYISSVPLQFVGEDKIFNQKGVEIPNV